MPIAHFDYRVPAQDERMYGECMVTSGIAPAPRPINSFSIDGVERIQVRLGIEFSGSDGEFEIRAFAPDGFGELANGSDGFQAFGGIGTLSALADRFEIDAFRAREQMQQIEVIVDRARDIAVK